MLLDELTMYFRMPIRYPIFCILATIDWFSARDKHSGSCWANYLILPRPLQVRSFSVKEDLSLHNTKHFLHPSQYFAFIINAILSL